MAETYTAYEAKAKLGEILRKVRAGRRVVISYRGEDIAEVRPLLAADSVEMQLKRHRERGTLGPLASRKGSLRTVKRKPGALERFLESRD